MVIRRLAVALIAMAIAAAACGGGTTVTTLPATLPPHERTDLAELFDPLVAPLGYHVTRAALIDRSTYAVDPSGGHLAIYLAFEVLRLQRSTVRRWFGSLSASVLPYVRRKIEHQRRENPRIDGFIREISEEILHGQRYLF